MKRGDSRMCFQWYSGQEGVLFQWSVVSESDPGVTS